MDRFVLDTCSLIDYYGPVFGERSQISNRATRIIDAAFDSTSEVVLIIPSVVFIELFDKYFNNDEYSSRIYYEVIVPILNCQKIEIRPIDRDTLHALATIKDDLAGHDMHDRIIVSVAVALECALITYDPLLVAFAQTSQAIPTVCP